MAFKWTGMDKKEAPSRTAAEEGEEMEVDDAQTFSESEVTTAGLYDVPLAGAAAAEQSLQAAQVAALSRFSEQIGSLLHNPNLAFCADARIALPAEAGGEPPREVAVHRCVLSARSSFFREKFAAGAAVLQLGDLAPGFEVGYEALVAVLEYVYTGRPEELPTGAAECVDESCSRHEACWPAVHFMLQVLYAASTFEIHELASLFQRRLLDILEKVATEDLLPVLIVANLCTKNCKKLHLRCTDMVVKSDIDHITLEKKLEKLPLGVIDQLREKRKDLGFLDKHVKIYRAIDTDDIELVKMFLRDSPTILDDAKALHYAMAFCDSKITKQLLDLELADVNGRDHRDYTLLHHAAMRKEPEIIMSLLTKGAQPFHATRDGRTALQIAKRHTRKIDYSRSVETTETTPRERVCIEMLVRAELRDSFTEVTAVPVEMTSNDLREKYWYLKSRVWLAKYFFPLEARTAGADEADALNFELNHLSASDVMKSSFRMTEEHYPGMKALEKTVERGMRFFPRCSNLINRILDDGLSEQTVMEVDNTEEKRMRFNEILEEFSEAFAQDLSSKPARAHRAKAAKR